MGIENLTKQETKIAGMVANGFIEKEIATKLFISPHTVHTHLKHIRKKLLAKNIADITRIYVFGFLTCCNNIDIFKNKFKK